MLVSTSVIFSISFDFSNYEILKLNIFMQIGLTTERNYHFKIHTLEKPFMNITSRYDKVFSNVIM